MKYILILSFALTLTFALNAEADVVDCRAAQGNIICLDNDNLAYIFSQDAGTMVVDMSTGRFVDMRTSEQGNIYTGIIVPEKKPGFFDRLGQFGRALEDAFEPNYYQHPQFRQNIPGYDPLCVTQLQRRVNKCGNDN